MNIDDDTLARHWRAHRYTTIYVKDTGCGIQHLVQIGEMMGNTKTLSVLFPPAFSFTSPVLSTGTQYSAIIPPFRRLLLGSIVPRLSLLKYHPNFPHPCSQRLPLARRTRLSKKSKNGPITSRLTGSRPSPPYVKYPTWHCGAHQTGIRRGGVMSPLLGLREGFGHRKEQTSRSKTQIFPRVGV